MNSEENFNILSLNSFNFNTRNSCIMDLKKEFYHIAFCVNDNYIKYICVTIRSILENNPKSNFIFHILIDKISSNSKRLLDSIKFKSEFKINIHYVDDSCLLGLNVGCWSKYTWYRIFIPNLITDVDIILYLDADTIVEDDISILFKINLNSYCAAGVIDCLEDMHKRRCGFCVQDNYFNAGVLLMNLSFWRQHNITEEILHYGISNNDRILFPDQDCINIIGKNKIKILPIKFNISESHFYNINFCKKYPAQLKEAYNRPSIIHYCGISSVPWFMESNNFFTPIWRKYNKILKYPVELKYSAKGLTKIKLFIWDLFHNRCENSKKRLVTHLKSQNIIE